MDGLAGMGVFLMEAGVVLVLLGIVWRVWPKENGRAAPPPRRAAESQPPRDGTGSGQ